MKLIKDKLIRKVSDSANSFIFLAFILARISANMEINVSKWQQLLADLDHLMDGCDILPPGLVLHAIILPGKLAELLHHVKRKVIEYFKEYEWAMTEIHQYFDLSLVNYIYISDMIVLQILIYVKHYILQTLELFSLQTVPVPFFLTESLDEKHTYTWLKPSHNILAMSSSSYLNLDLKQLPNCRFSSAYYCENLFLVTHSSRKAC